MIIPRNFTLMREMYLRFIHIFSLIFDFLKNWRQLIMICQQYLEIIYSFATTRKHFNSQLMCISIVFRSSPLINTLESSANIIVSKIPQTFSKAFTYIENDKVPSIDHWGQCYGSYIRLIIIIEGILFSISHMAFYSVQSNTPHTLVI